MNRRRILLFIVSTSLLFLAGCGSGKYQPVTGEIIFPDGSPVKGLEGGQIAFQKIGSQEEAKTAAGAIDANGKFALGTEQLADGAETGDYSVVITPPQSTGDVPLPKVIDDKYTKVGGVTEKFTVQKGKNHFQVKVEPAPKQ
jgi:hypothetical protein